MITNLFNYASLRYQTVSDKTKAREIIREEIRSLQAGNQVRESCAACHVIFTLVEKMSTNESDAADLLSQVLSEEPSLNDEFIGVVEDIHMRSRNMAMNFYMRNRQAKDRYIESYFKNALTELQADAETHGTRMQLRKVVLNYLSSYLAQTLGLDFHASTEELYYVVRKHPDFDNYLEEFIERFAKGLKTG